MWLIKGLGPGGAEQQLLELARVADSDRFAPQVVFALDWKDRLAPPIRDAGVPTDCLGVRTLADLRWVLRLRRHLRDDEIDIVHSHSPLLAVVARLLAPTVRSRPLLVSTEHNVWLARRPLTRMMNALTYRLDDAHIAVSARVRDSLPSRLRSSTEVIDHGVDVARIGCLRHRRTDTRASLGIADDTLVVCTIANFRWQKGYTELLTAVRLLRDQGRQFIVLVIGQGPLEQEVRELRDRLGLTDDVQLLGHRWDAVEILAACDVLAIASRHEGYPIVALEALAAGIPIVSTDVGAVPTIVTDGIEGRVVPVDDGTAFAAALGELIDDHDTRSQMSIAALRRGADYDIRRSLESLTQMYERLMATR